MLFTLLFNVNKNIKILVGINVIKQFFPIERHRCGWMNGWFCKIVFKLKADER